MPDGPGWYPRGEGLEADGGSSQRANGIGDQGCATAGGRQSLPSAAGAVPHPGHPQPSQSLSVSVSAHSCLDQARRQPPLGWCHFGGFPTLMISLRRTTHTLRACHQIGTTPQNLVTFVWLSCSSFARRFDNQPLFPHSSGRFLRAAAVQGSRPNLPVATIRHVAQDARLGAAQWRGQWQLSEERQRSLGLVRHRYIHISMRGRLRTRKPDSNEHRRVMRPLYRPLYAETGTNPTLVVQLHPSPSCMHRGSRKISCRRSVFETGLGGRQGRVSVLATCRLVDCNMGTGQR